MVLDPLPSALRASPGMTRGLAAKDLRRTIRHGSKERQRKKWPLRRAAKFREETPRKGGGFAIEIAIPRCNNMPEEELVCKQH
jgi:hypothetical protein